MGPIDPVEDEGDKLDEIEELVLSFWAMIDACKRGPSKGSNGLKFTLF